MSIRKNATNIKIKVNTSYSLLVGGKLEKIAGEIFVDSTKKDLKLCSNKKIIVDGNKH